MLAFILTAADGDAWKFPGWKCTDLATLNQALNTAPDPILKASTKIMIELTKKPAQSFAELAATIDQALGETALTNKAFLEDWNDKNKADIAIRLKKEFAFNLRSFLTDAWTFCQANPSRYDLYYVLYKADKLKLTPQFQYDFFKNFLLTTRIDMDYASDEIARALDAFIELAANHDPAEVKDVLVQLNRRFTKMLLTDKAKWQPIIAMIRLTLETY